MQSKYNLFRVNYTTPLHPMGASASQLNCSLLGTTRVADNAVMKSNDLEIAKVNGLKVFYCIIALPICVLEMAKFTRTDF
jgi:hypothetical protein